MSDNADRRILVVTAKFVEVTGTISFGFMGRCAYPRMSDMPKPFGHVWADHAEADGRHSINVFEDGRLVMGGGWTPEDTPEHEEAMLDGVPSCTLLMNAETFGWWNVLCAQYGVAFEHHHFEGGLKTG